MIVFEESERQRAVLTPMLRLRFNWIEDRWTHVLEIRKADTFQLVAEGVEAHPERDDPTQVISPTYQDLHFQRDGDTALALTVGRFGPHHFSASFRVEARPDSTLIQVDVADRCRGQIEALAATYRVAAPPTVLDAPGDKLARWTLPDSEAVLMLSASGSSWLTVAESGPSTVLAQAGTKPEPGQSTHRLLYTWRVALPPATS